MAITLLKGHVSRALDFYNKNSIFFGIGKTTAWSDPSDSSINDYKPPTPKNTDSLQEVVGYRRVDSKYLVKPAEDSDSTAELTYGGKKWKIITPNRALEEGARWVCVLSNIQYSEFPTNISYRQIEVVSGLVPADSVVDGRANLLPSQVKDVGIPEVLDNRTPIFREPDQREKLIVIIEF